MYILYTVEVNDTKRKKKVDPIWLPRKAERYVVGIGTRRAMFTTDSQATDIVVESTEAPFTQRGLFVNNSVDSRFSV